jgi:hypothetical protein
MQKILLVVCILLFPLLAVAQQREVSGIVTDAAGKRLPFASVYAENSTLNTLANEGGFYTLRLVPGSYKLIFGQIGNQFRSISEKTQL